MTVTRWSQVIFTLGALFILTGCWLLWPAPVLLLGIALMVPAAVLSVIYVRNMQ